MSTDRDVCTAHGERGTFTATYDYIREPGCTCVIVRQSAPVSTDRDDLTRVLAEHREDALTCYDHDGPGVWCCVCGAHGLTGAWRDHVAAAAGQARDEGMAKGSRRRTEGR